MDNQFESFRPDLERIIENGKMKEFVRDRILIGRGPTIQLHYSLPPEPPESLLLYFAGVRFNNPGNTYREEILGAARELLGELAHEIPSGENTFDYVNGLGFLLEWGKDRQSCPIALDLLLSKGDPSITPPYFSLDGEARLLNVFAMNYDPALPQERKDQAKALFLKYITNGEFHYDLIQNAFYALFRLDYSAAIKMLPQVFNQASPYNFAGVAWNMVVLGTEADRNLLAHELVTLEPRNIDYFMEALRRSSAEFEDEITSRFRDKVRELRSI